jgi:hypothetical protein
LTKNTRIAFLAVAAAIAVVAVIVLSGGGEEKSATSTAVLEAGTPGKVEATEGEEVTFTVRSDTADEVHVHGYDVKKDVEAGGEVEFTIDANITGIFEIELENAGEKVGELVVKPT